MFFLNWKNGVNYQMVAQTPQYKMDSMQDLRIFRLISRAPEIPRFWQTSHRSTEETIWRSSPSATCGASSISTVPCKTAISVE
jgi:hypothetical protein